MKCGRQSPFTYVEQFGKLGKVGESWVLGRAFGSGLFKYRVDPDTHCSHAC
jgi:hypothetical protein